jgi:glycosyltransferase involved in cell wall biosynthesis
MNTSKKPPTVSVILTSYNHGKYLGEAIESVLNQTFQDFELFIWDDASADDSWHIISAYHDDRIKAFRNEINRGPVFGINKAISELATGDYIAIHHSDDVWETTKLQQQVDFLNTHPEIGAVFSNALAINEEGLPLVDVPHFYANVFQQTNKTRHEWLHFFFTQANALCHPSVLIRKQCYEDCGLYRPMLAQLPDFDMWIRLCLKYEIYILPEPLIRFRVLNQEANTSGNRPETRIRWSYEFYKVLDNYQSIHSFDDLVRIFPTAQTYYRGTDTSVQFALAMVALKEENSTFTELFAQNILFSLISDPKQLTLIKQQYDFDYLSFINITAQHDIFSCEKTQTLQQDITDRDAQIKKFLADNQEPALKTNLLWIWKIINRLRQSLARKMSRQPISSEKPHFAPPSDDCCFIVPFSYPLENPSVEPNLAVICHLYYPAMIEEFKRYLSNIPFAFDLFITTDTEEKKQTIAYSLLQWHKGKVEIRIAPNRGRDIAPKLLACRDIYEHYEFFLHIHSKKSPHAEDITEGWRYYLLETLLGSEQIVQSVFAAFAADSQLGMIAPEHFEPIRSHIGWGWNFPVAKAFSSRLGLNLSPNSKLDFPSGSMFWGRSAALKPLLTMNLTSDDFPLEDNQIDATLAHIIERMYFFICELAGYRWIKIANPKLKRTLSVTSKDALIESIQRTQYHLLASHENVLP